MFRCTALTISAVVVWACVPAVAAERTQRLRYSPFAADGSARASLRITPHFGGECASASFVVPGDAYRCFDGNFIRDPCYLDRLASDTTGRDVVLCVSAPWSRSVVRLRADSLDESFPRPPGGPPWALVLSSGSRCVFASGASGAVGGRRLNYVCGRTRFLFGSPDTSRALWRIRAARSFDGAGMRKVAIRTAWR